MAAREEDADQYELNFTKAAHFAHTQFETFPADLANYVEIIAGWPLERACA